MPPLTSSLFILLGLLLILLLILLLVLLILLCILLIVYWEDEVLAIDEKVSTHAGDDRAWEGVSTKALFQAVHSARLLSGKRGVCVRERRDVLNEDVVQGLKHFVREENHVANVPARFYVYFADVLAVVGLLNHGE